MGVCASPKSRRDGRNQGMVSLVWSVAKIWHGMSLVWSGLVGLVWLVQLVWLVWFAGLVRLRQPALPGSIGRGPRGLEWPLRLAPGLWQVGWSVGFTGPRELSGPAGGPTSRYLLGLD